MLVKYMQNKTALLVILVLIMSACTNQDIYKTVQRNGQQECQKRPPSEYDDCMQEYSTDYEWYKKSRDDLLDSEG